MRKLLRELETAGYARLERRRRPNGTLAGSRWIIDEGGFSFAQSPSARVCNGASEGTIDLLFERLDHLEDKLDRIRLGDDLDVLTTAEVRAVLGIGRTKLNELIQSGELKMWKLGGELVARYRVSRRLAERALAER